MRYLIIIFLNLNLYAYDLEYLDSFRLKINEGKIIMTVITNSKSRGNIIKKYKVFRKNKNSALILFENISQRGDIVLKEKNNFYIKTKSSKYPIRITPIQRLSGDASIGDVLEINLKDSYKKIKEEKDFIYLEAKEKSSTYSKIRLKIKDKKPFSAELYSISGKLLKTVYYIYNNKNKIHKFNFITKGSKTNISIDYIEEKSLSNKIFRKSFLKKAYSYAKNL